MNAIQDEPASLEEAAELAPSPPLLRTLVACDLVESTALAQQLGDRSIADVMHLLDRHARDLVERHAGQEIDKTDGFLLMFDRPVQAIGFALDYQRLLHELTLSEFLPLKARIGIHVGDVVLWRNNPADIARGAKPLEVEGLVKPVAARLMGLALPGQILLSGVARALALRAQDELEIEFPPEWRMHGRYVFKGVAEPVPVFEVGETGIAPLRQPAYSSKAYRETPWWRRPGLLALEAAVVLSAVVVPTWIFLRSPPVIAFAERDWVVVGSLKNLTEEHRFDDALDTAFRLGLQQSRYVNVLSDLKTRETIALMQRDPDKTLIDRTIGSEIAIRDGARALILPTVAEVGRNVRVTAEVIDPRSQTTVYTESAEGVGAESVLQSVDQINQRLRERLGEAMAVVAKDSQPLDKVTTRNLDALRAYSLAERAYEASRFQESVNFYKQAIKVDPDFALAHAHFARSLLVMDNSEAAAGELDKALSLHDHLGARDALYVDAWHDTLSGSQRAALDKWKTLSALYPDFFTAQSLFSYFSFQLANRFGEDVVAAARAAASEHNPHPLANRLLLANLFLSNEQYDRAQENFTAVEQASHVNHFMCAFAYAAQRRFDQAEAALARGISAEEAGAEVSRYIPLIALAVDRHQTEKAFELLERARSQAAKADPHYSLPFQGMELSLRVVSDPREKVSQPLASYAAALRKSLAESTVFNRSDTQFQMLFAAYLAAEAHLVPQAESLLRDVGPEPTTDQYPMLAKMLAIAKADIQIASSRPDEAIDLLKAQVDGSELYLTHAVLSKAYSENGDARSAEAEEQWLASHRGRAYAEFSMRAMLMPLNVALSNSTQRSP
jgi:putative peptide modification system cyclase